MLSGVIKKLFVMLNIKESTIESKVCRYARSLGWLAYKFTSPSFKGVPDRIFIRKGVIFFIEFKSLGKKPTKLQAKTIDRIRSQGFDVYVVDNIDKGYKIFNKYEKK